MTPGLVSRKPPHRRGWIVVGLGIAFASLLASLWLRPPSPGQIFQNGREALRAGDLARAQESMDQLSDFPEFAPHRRFIQGALLLAEGNFNDSLEEFRHTVSHPELEVDTNVLSGQALYHMGRVSEARQLWRTVLKLNPSKVSAHQWLSVLYYDLGAMEDALTHLEEVARLSPDDSRPHRLMGKIYKDYERYKEAADCYQESLLRKPNQPDREQVLVELAESQVQLSRFKEAMQTLASCTDSERVVSLRADSLIGLGEPEQAAEIVRKALASSPDDLSLLNVIGRILSEQGEYQEAIAFLARAATAHPLDYTTHYNLSQAYSRAGNNAKAEEIGELAKGLKEKWESFSALNTQAIAEPFNAEIRYRLGMMAGELDRDDLAKTWLKAALAIDPTHAKSHSALQRLP